MNLKRSDGLLLVLLLVAASGRAAHGEQRDPFQPPAADTPSAVRSPVKGVVGDGQCWHFWTTDEGGRWRRRDPPSSGQRPRKEVAGDPPGNGNCF